MLHDMLSKYLNSIEVYVRKLDKVYHLHGPDDVSDASKPSIEKMIEEAVFTEQKLK